MNAAITTNDMQWQHNYKRTEEERPTGTVGKTLQTLKQNEIGYLGPIAKSKLVIRHAENLISGMSSAFLKQKYTYKIYRRCCSHWYHYDVICRGVLVRTVRARTRVYRGCAAHGKGVETLNAMSMRMHPPWCILQAAIDPDDLEQSTNPTESGNYRFRLMGQGAISPTTRLSFLARISRLKTRVTPRKSRTIK